MQLEPFKEHQFPGEYSQALGPSQSVLVQNGGCAADGVGLRRWPHARAIPRMPAARTVRRMCMAPSVMLGVWRYVKCVAYRRRTRSGAQRMVVLRRVVRSILYSEIIGVRVDCAPWQLVPDVAPRGMLEGLPPTAAAPRLLSSGHTLQSVSESWYHLGGNCRSPLGAGSLSTRAPQHRSAPARPLTVLQITRMVLEPPTLPLRREMQQKADEQPLGKRSTHRVGQLYSDDWTDLRLPPGIGRRRESRGSASSGAAALRTRPCPEVKESRRRGDPCTSTLDGARRRMRRDRASSAAVSDLHACRVSFFGFNA